MYQYKTLQSFNWDAFEELLTPPCTRLASDVVSHLIEKEQVDEFPEIFDQDEDPVPVAEKIFSDKEWYPPDIEANDSFQKDRLIDLIFHGLYEKELDLQTPLSELSYEVYDVIDYSLEYLEKGHVPLWRRLFSASTNTNREIDSLGHRPFRCKDWKKIRYSDEPARYSIHTPQQVKQMLIEIEPCKIAADTKFKSEDLFQKFVTDLWTPLQHTAMNDLALFANDGD